MSATSVYFRAVFWLAIMTGCDACSNSEGRSGDVKDGEGFSMTVPKGEKYSCARARWITMLLLVVFSVVIVSLMGLFWFVLKGLFLLSMFRKRKTKLHDLHVIS